MSITEQRLKDYQLQMSIYAEQHKMLLASDVLDMIEQLQDDLKDDMNKVVKQLEEVGQKMSESKSIQKYGKSSPANHRYYKAVSVKRAIEIVKGGGLDEV